MAENCKYPILVSARAKKALGAHIRFVAQIDPATARLRKKKILDSLASLSQNPDRFPISEEPLLPPGKYHQMTIEKWYLVFYQVREETVYIEYILDCHKDYDWLLP